MDPYAVAIHEAGHAVLSWVLDDDLDLFCVRITVEPDELDTAGLVVLPDPPDGLDLADTFSAEDRHTGFLLRRITVSAAGLEAAKRLGVNQEPGSGLNRYGGYICPEPESDWDLMVRLSLFVAKNDSQRAGLFMQLGIDQAALLVERHWPAIEEVARALVEHHTIDPSVVARAVLAHAPADGYGATIVA